MKTFYSLTAALTLLLFASQQSQACQNSSFNLVSETDLGGGFYEFTVNFCVGNTASGASGNTLLWGVWLDNGATFSTFPASLTSPATGAVYVADNVSYGPELLVFENYTTGGWAGSWACTNSACGTNMQVCKTFTFVTNGHPNNMTLMGAEGDGVGVAPYGCNGDPSMVIQLQGMTVDAGNTAYFCLGNCTNLSAAVSGGVAPYTYTWTKQFSGGSAGNTATINVCPTQNELYLLTVTDANGSVGSDFVNVYVYQPPTVSAGADQNIYIGYGASCVTLSAYANGSMNPYTYSWSNGSTNKNNYVCPTATTTYTLTSTDARGCSASDAVVVNVQDIRCGNGKVRMCKNGSNYCIKTNQVPTKLNQGYTLGSCGSNKMGDGEEILELMDTEVYPNPAADNITISYGFEDDALVTLEVYDVSGRMVQTVKSNVEVKAYEMNVSTFSVSDYKAGLYMIAITSSTGEREMHRFMVAH